MKSQRYGRIFVRLKAIYQVVLFAYMPSNNAIRPNFYLASNCHRYTALCYIIQVFDPIFVQEIE